MDKGIVFILVIAVAVLGLVFVSTLDDDSNAVLNNNSFDGNKTVLNVSSEGPIELSKIVEDIKTNSFYEGYNVETLKWMESLGNMWVFMSSDEIVIMDETESGKIPSAYVCDAYFQEIFSCDVLENRSLNTQFKKDVLLVDNVEFIEEEVHYGDV